MMIDINKFDIYIGLAVTGIFSGVGSAIGNYLATKHIIEGSRRILKKFKGGIR